MNGRPAMRLPFVDAHVHLWDLTRPGYGWLRPPFREDVPGGYSDRDSLLYAVAIGMGRDPMDRKELAYVCETMGDQVVPTAATVLSRPSRARASIVRARSSFGSRLPPAGNSPPGK